MQNGVRTFFIYLFIIVWSFLFLYNYPCHGLDTDLYTVTGQQVPPNVLFILDNSSSMAESQPSVPLYNADRTNPAPTYSGSYSTNTVYKKSANGNDWVHYIDNYSTILCSAVRDSLAIDGIYNGKLKSDTDCSTTGSAVFLQTGNYMNYLALTGTSNQPRLGLAKGTLHSYVNSTEGVRFGLMVFNRDPKDGMGGLVTAPVSDDKNTLFSALSNIQTSDLVNWTPLAETLYEAMLYFQGAASYYNSPTTYTSPIQYSCQKNYVVIITDGAPTYDVADDPTSPIPTVIGDYDNDGLDSGTYGDSLLKGSHYLDDVAKYVHLNDLSTAFAGRQNMTVYTIGFNPSQLAFDTNLLESTATKGGGQYHYAHNSQTFKAALQSIIEEILAKSVSFVAPTVPISQMEKTASSNRIYLGMFKVAEKSFWKGNVKKFEIATARATGVEIGDILDKNGNKAIDPGTSGIYDTAISYWSTTEDGGDVERGGVGSLLLNRDFSTNPRMIYTYLGNADLTDLSNRFNTTNILPATLGYASEDDRNKLINFLYGYDAYDEDLDLNTTEKRSWIMGGIIHSRPLVVNYSSPSSRSVIFVGTNDGMLHAFDDSDGRELWAFIPPDLLPKLKNLQGNTVEFFVDGSPKVYEDSTQKILICGERRGGNRYFALNITDPESPRWLWQIQPAGDYSEIGQTWSTPILGKIKYGTKGSWVDKWVMFIGGGYDDVHQDSLPATQDSVTGGDTKGYAVYVVDVLTGAMVWKYSYSDNSAMKYSIPSDVAKVDTDGDGRIDRLYAGDMGGQMWRFDIGLHETTASPANWTANRIFNSNDPAPSSGVDRRKIFYPPDVGLEKDSVGNYEAVIFGTGDREHPKETSVYNRLYAVKDRNPTTALTEVNLVDVTLDLLQTGTSEQKEATYTQLKSQSGWYILLNVNSGEKCLASCLLIYGVSYYTTFTPQIGPPTDPCFVGEGTARLYAVAYLTGNAFFNFDLTSDTMTTNDRSITIGTAIPSGAIIAIVAGTSTTGYIGIGGGVYKAPLRSTKVLLPITWKQNF